MFKQNDPVVDSVKKVMAENQRRRDVETKVNEELGIYSKKALPFEHHAEYDDLLAQRINEALHPNQQKLDVHEPEKDKLTADDFKMLRSKKKMPQGPEYAEKRRKERLASNGRMDEEEGEETREGGAVTRDNKPVVSPTATRVGEPSARKAPTEGPSASQRDALTNKIKSIMKEAQINEAVPLPPRRPQTGPAGTASQPQASNPRGDVVTGIEKTGGGEYNKYKKDSTSASEFQNIYGAARKSGSGSFEWQGRKYTTGQKGGAYVKPADQAAAENKPGSGSTTALNQLPKNPDVEASRNQTPSGRIDRTAMPSVQNALRGDESPENNTDLDNASRTTAAAQLIASAARKADRPAPGQTGGPGPLVSNPDALTLGQRAAESRRAEAARQAAAPNPEKIDEAAKSKAQQRIMGMALAMRRGESDSGSDKVKKIATDMSDEEMRKFAKTKRKGLPDRVKKEEVSFDDVMEEIARNLGKQKMKEITEDDYEPDPTPAQQGARNPGQALKKLLGPPIGGEVLSPVSRENQMPANKAQGSSFDPPAIAQQRQQSPIRPGSGGSDVSTSARTGVPDRRIDTRAPVQAAKGEGQTGKALAQLGVSRDDRRSQSFVDKEFGAGKFTAGSAESNLALQKKNQSQRDTSMARERASTYNPPTPPPRPARLRESLESTIRKILNG